jgi:hypothetical protein
MKKSKFTNWYPPHIKPVRVGVYQVEHPLSIDAVYCYWDGKHWGYFKADVNAAAKDRWKGKYVPTHYAPAQNKVWRGLAEETFA